MSNRLENIAKKIAEKRKELFNYTKLVATKKANKNNSKSKNLLRELTNLQKLQSNLQHFDESTYNNEPFTRPRSHMGGTRRNRRTRRKSLKNY